MLNGLTDPQLDQLASASTRRSFPKGRTIVSEGEPSSSMYILLSGRAKVQRCDTEGKEVILAVLRPGEFFGEMSLIDDEPRSASVVTLEPCDFIGIRKDGFKHLIGSNVDVAMNILKSMVRRLREADKKIETLALMDVYGRVARVLLEFSVEEDGDRVVKGRLCLWITAAEHGFVIGYALR